MSSTFHTLGTLGRASFHNPSISSQNIDSNHPSGISTSDQPVVRIFSEEKDALLLSILSRTNNLEPEEKNKFFNKVTNIAEGVDQVTQIATVVDPEDIITNNIIEAKNTATNNSDDTLIEGISADQIKQLLTDSDGRVGRTASYYVLYRILYNGKRHNEEPQSFFGNIEERANRIMRANALQVPFQVLSNIPQVSNGQESKIDDYNDGETKDNMHEGNTHTINNELLESKGYDDEDGFLEINPIYSKSAKKSLTNIEFMENLNKLSDGLNHDINLSQEEITSNSNHLLSLIHTESDAKRLDGALLDLTNSIKVHGNDEMKILQSEKLQRLILLCNGLLNCKSVTFDYSMHQRITSIFMSAVFARATILTTLEPNEPYKTIVDQAKNELFVMFFTLRKIQKDLAHSLDKVDMSNGRAFDSNRNNALNLAGTTFGYNAALSGHAIIPGNYFNSKILVMTLTMMGAGYGQRAVNNSAVNGLNLLKSYSGIGRKWYQINTNTELKMHMKDQKSSAQQIHADVKSLFKQLKKRNGVVNDEMQKNYSELLDKLHAGLDDRTISVMQIRSMTGKVPLMYINDKGEIKFTKSRGSLLQLMDVLGTSLYPENQLQSSETLAVNNLRNKFHEICEKCYFPNVAGITTITQLEPEVDKILKSTPWSSQVHSYDAIHRLHFIIYNSNVSPNIKSLVSESVGNKLSQIKELAKHRSSFNVKVALPGAIGTGFFNVPTYLPIITGMPLPPLPGLNHPSSPFSSFLGSVFNLPNTSLALGVGALGAPPLGAPWRGASTHGFSTQQQIRKLQESRFALDQTDSKGTFALIPEVENIDELKQPTIAELPTGSLEQGTIAELPKEMKSQTIATLAQNLIGKIQNNTFEMTNVVQEIEDFVSNACNADDEAGKKCIIKLVLEFNVVHNKTQVPLIFLLQSKLTGEKQTEILEFYFKNVVTSYNFVRDSEKFNDVLRLRKSTSGEAMLHFCQGLAIIKHYSLNGNNQELAATMSRRLTGALSRSRSDKTSLWRVLTQVNAWRTIAISVLLGMASFFLSVAAVAAGAWITPAGSFCAIVLIFGAKNVMERWLIERYGYDHTVTNGMMDILKQTGSKNSPIEIKGTKKQRDEEVQAIKNEIKDTLRLKKDDSLNKSVFRLTRFLEERTYDKFSFLTHLEAIVEHVGNEEFEISEENQSLIISALRVRIMEMGKLRNIMKQGGSNHGYNFFAGMVSGLLFALFMVPYQFVPPVNVVTHVPVPVIGGNIDWIKRIEATVAAALQAIMPPRERFEELVSTSSRLGKWLMTTETQEEADIIFDNALQRIAEA